MNLGFYYHIALHSDHNGLNVPAFLGLFIDSLASEVEGLTLFMHEATEQDAVHCDYILKAENVEFVSLGKKNSAWERFLFPNRTLIKISSELQKCNTLLIRAPSPLAPAFYRKFHKIIQVNYLIVGDYLDGIKYLHQPLLRKWAIQLLTSRNDNQLRNVISKTLTLVNSNNLYNKYKSISQYLKVVRTTTISEQDFYYRNDTCNAGIINILYTGRMDLAKGLRELVWAVVELQREKFNIILHFAAWEEDPEKPIEKLLLKIIDESKIQDKVVFHGRKTLGKDLNLLYQMADIYAIPSYHEGFPRSIWEAMANGLPVIATNVGSISSFVGDSVLIIRPQEISDLVNAIKTVILNHEVRRDLIAKGYKKAKENTLEIRVKEIVDILKEGYILNPLDH